MRWIQSLVTDSERDVFTGSPGIGVLASSARAGAVSAGDVLGAARALGWTPDLTGMPPDQVPERLRLSVTRGGAHALSFTTHAGADRAGRPGNVLTHVCLVDEDDGGGGYGSGLGGLRPAQTWGSAGWLRAQSARQAAGLVLDENGPGPAPDMAVAALWSFLHERSGGRRAGSTGEFFNGVETVLDGRSGRLAIIEETPGDVARWAAVATQLMSRAAAWTVTFSTYEDPTEVDRLSREETGMLLGLLLREVSSTGMPSSMPVFDPSRGSAPGAPGGARGDGRHAWAELAREVWELPAGDCAAFLDELDQILGEIVDRSAHPLYQLPLCVLLGSEHGLDRSLALGPALALAPPGADPSNGLLSALLAALSAFGDPFELIDRTARVTRSTWGEWPEALATLQLLSIVGGRPDRLPDIPRQWIPPLRQDRADLVAGAVADAVVATGLQFFQDDGGGGILRLAVVLSDVGVLQRLDDATRVELGAALEDEVDQERQRATESAAYSRRGQLPPDLVELVLPGMELRRERDRQSWHPLTAADERWLDLRWTNQLRRRYPGLAEDAMLREVAVHGGEDDRLNRAVAALVAGLGPIGRSEILDLRVRRLLGGRPPTVSELRAFHEANPSPTDWERLTVRCLAATVRSADYSWMLKLCGGDRRKTAEDLVHLHLRLFDRLADPVSLPAPRNGADARSFHDELAEWDTWLAGTGYAERFDPWPLREQLRAVALATVLAWRTAGIDDVARLEMVSVGAAPQAVERALALLDESRLVSNDDRRGALVLAVGLTVVTAADRGVSRAFGGQPAVDHSSYVDQAPTDAAAVVELVNQVFGRRLADVVALGVQDLFFDELRQLLDLRPPDPFVDSAADLLERGWTHHSLRDRLRRRPFRAEP